MDELFDEEEQSGFCGQWMNSLMNKNKAFVDFNEVFEKQTKKVLWMMDEQFDEEEHTKKKNTPKRFYGRWMSSFVEDGR
ncbi:hypothetical protein DEO72_LG7g2477 [Vigna unguiculata]|uniref:Uncharacterized protein n=1 Tax=Vigna unguiculata TaxID=3917 RepID=A0A4D6MIF3_VIGUN|nr:hypothetical protein DEO72_LG7g2477 [Vigna unguiculata]